MSTHVLEPSCMLFTKLFTSSRILNQLFSPPEVFTRDKLVSRKEGANCVVERIKRARAHKGALPPCPFAEGSTPRRAAPLRQQYDFGSAYIIGSRGSDKVGWGTLDFRLLPALLLTP